MMGRAEANKAVHDFIYKKPRKGTVRWRETANIENGMLRTRQITFHRPKTIIQDQIEQQYLKMVNEDIIFNKTRMDRGMRNEKS